MKKQHKFFEKWKGYIYLAPAIIIMVVFTVYPLIRTFIMSFMKNYSLVKGTFSGWTLQNYADLFDSTTSTYFVPALQNTALYVVFVVPLTLIFSLIIAAMINSTIRTRGLWQTLYFLPYVTSVIAIGIVWRWMYNSNYGLINYFLSWFGVDPIPWLLSTKYAMPALIIFGVWKGMAFDILIFLSALSSVPEQIYQAARIDSTPSWRVFFKITVPSIMPIIVYACIMGVINAFKVYNEVYALFNNSAGPSNSAMTVVYYIYNRFYIYADYGRAAAAAVVLFFIILALTLLQRAIGSRGSSKEVASK